MINSDLGFKLEEVLPKFSVNLQEKIQHSVELLRKSERLALAYDSEDGFYLAFSGGKDSQCLYHIASLAGVKFKAHMSLTSVDPPEVIRFVKKQYPDVNLVKPKKSIYQAAIDHQILPTMRVRWCCKEYKEGAGAGKVTLIVLDMRKVQGEPIEMKWKLVAESIVATLKDLMNIEKHEMPKSEVVSQRITEKLPLLMPQESEH